jgi:hypothetical protein
LPKLPTGDKEKDNKLNFSEKLLNKKRVMDNGRNKD